MLGAIALVWPGRGETVALASVFVALVGSFLVSYTRARAEAIGLRCEVGLMAGRADRAGGGGAALRQPRTCRGRSRSWPR